MNSSVIMQWINDFSNKTPQSINISKHKQSKKIYVHPTPNQISSIMHEWVLYYVNDNDAVLSYRDTKQIPWLFLLRLNVTLFDWRRNCDIMCISWFINCCYGNWWIIFSMLKESICWFCVFLMTWWTNT